ncbi:DUF3426 domain-containing protein [Paradevosia shaoguanensis]|uniref:Zinc-ribbon domain-containing protein n=1 Tax=Paradevosia shaoguanensis TaxID=1335043 RepID=A0AA41QSD1_9HYPH|nr:DUF3426 domain-containing protein [Paradevosia shaoguanensis]MCF1744984.1 zinc-ribbon domain-containing protein [Paradevosia shaoguanensis]MCI0129467.1 zinc-ribbon domain-containing protein [Paradevosia shaoguanensis]
MIITCPHCQTRYQIALETIGSAGRKVQCANCGEAWQAAPEFPKPRPKPTLVQPGEEYPDDKLFDDDDEAVLDAEFAAQERRAAQEQQPGVMARAAEDDFVDVDGEVIETESVPATASPRPRVDPALARKQQRAFFRRQNARVRQLPLARVRRTARILVAAALLLLLGGGVFFRTEIVRQLPALAGLYESVGLSVNVVGLEIRDLKTMRSQRAGNDILSIEARIYSVANRIVRVPSVVVTLLDASGGALYEWSVAPQANDLKPGEVVDFSTELPKPPVGAAGVRLTFASSRGQSQVAIATANNQDSETQ